MPVQDVLKTELAVGFFDGVHIGHQKLLSAMLERARVAHAKPAVFTFTNHPTSVYAPERVPKLLTATNGRFSLLKSYGVEKIVALDFTQDVARQTPEQFAVYLRETFPALDTIFCGANWTFGYKGLGNADFLRERGFSVNEVSFAEVNGEVVSSTRIRKALADGQLKDAAKMLGRDYSAQGKVFKGKGIGKTIGFPTVNLQMEQLSNGLLPCGVYHVETCFGSGLANWGVAPTMGSDSWASPVLEVHLINVEEGMLLSLLDGDLCKVSFKYFIRPEKKFDSISELQRQICLDVESLKSLMERK